MAADLRLSGTLVRHAVHDVCGHHLPISLMSAGRSVQLLETELSLSPVLDYEKVCLQTLVTLCRGSGENFSFDGLIPLF